MSKISNQGGNVGQIDAMRGAQGVERANVGSVNGMRVEVGEGARQPSRAGETLNAVKNFFKDLRSGFHDAFATLKDKVRTAYQDFQGWRAAGGGGAGAAQQAQAPANVQAVQAPPVQTFDEKRTALLDVLPSGVAINDQGVVSGSHVAHAFPNDPAIGPQAGKTIKDVLENSGRAQLAPTDPKTGQPASLPVIGGIPVGGQAVKDLYRLDITIGSGTGAYKSSQDATTNGERNKSVVANLRNFTGSDQATTVLTSVINQQFSRVFTDSWSKADGSRSVCQIEQGKTGPVDYRAADDSVSSITPGGIGTAPINITLTPNNDFKIEINWDMYYSAAGRGFNKTEFPGMDGSVMKAGGHVEFVVDGAAARAGRLDLTVTQPATITFEGKMTP
ncbi:hypothetical protein [Aureimonas sp. AU4]|uniref:hypothetical protein n=1 Tax=Aureimonas sp. AU4 TaxID=1638163 RepID=UPI000784FB2F|nr:hypothetical protein [Aureimonas sp. AU4]